MRTPCDGLAGTTSRSRSAFRRGQTLIRAAHFGAALRLSADHRPSFVQCPRSMREMDRPPGFPIGPEFFFDEVDEVHGRAALGCG